jgi:hypothetical protein
LFDLKVNGFSDKHNISIYFRNYNPAKAKRIKISLYNYVQYKILGIMKKLFFPIIASFIIFFPAYTQIEENEVEVPIETLTLKKENIPVSIVQAVNKSFQNGSALEWYSFPYLLKEYGWAFESKGNATIESALPDLYAVHIKTSKGSRVDAIYTKDGNILRSKEVIVNSMLPLPVTKAIETGPYKGWIIVGDRSIIKVARNNLVHYAVKVEHGNTRRTLYFDKNGNQLKNRL